MVMSISNAPSSPEPDVGRTAPRGDDRLVGWRCIVVGGAGAVGGMFVELLQGAGADVRVVDPAFERQGPNPRPDGLEYEDVLNPTPRMTDALGRADLVILAVPERVALAALMPVVGALRPGALVVDTLSVKTPIVTAATTVASHGVQMISLNPMFAPSLGIGGRPIAAVTVNDGWRVQELLRLIGDRGGEIVRVDAAEHDRITAATQVLTHAAVIAFGFAIGELGVDPDIVRAVAPPPYATLMALLARITTGAAETYWDIQVANPQASHARQALADGLCRLAQLVESGDGDAFKAALDGVRGSVGPDLEHHRNMCVRIFEGMTHVDTTGGNHGSGAAADGPAHQLDGHPHRQDL